MNLLARAFDDRIALRGLTDAKAISAFTDKPKRQYVFAGAKVSFDWWAFDGGSVNIYVARFDWKHWWRKGSVIVTVDHIQQRIEMLKRHNLPCEQEQQAIRDLVLVKMSGKTPDTELIMGLWAAWESATK